MWLIVVAYVVVGFWCCVAALAGPRPQEVRSTLLGFLSVGCIALLRDLYVYLGGTSTLQPTWVAEVLQFCVGVAIVGSLSIVALMVGGCSEDC